MLDSLKLRLQRVTSNKIYLAEVDGLRFLAIFLVLFFHMYGYFHSRFDQTIVLKGEDFVMLNTAFINGDRGVQLFFVLSGFVLCLPFAQSFKNKVMPPDLKKYYGRRLTRLEPPYIIAMTLLCIAAVIVYEAQWKLWLSSLLASLFYVHGLLFGAPSYINVVAWSLEVEVQFYLVAPLLFHLFRLPVVWRRGSIIITSALTLYLTYFYFPGYLTLFHQLPYFLMGILLADWYVNEQYVDFFSGKCGVPLAVLLLPVIIYLPWKTNFYSIWLFPIAVFVFYYCALKNKWVKAAFSMGWIPVIGGMCYSIYLLHYPIISLAGKGAILLEVGDFYLINLILQFSLLLIAILVVSAFFYLLVERPFMMGGWKFRIFKTRLVK